MGPAYGSRAIGMYPGIFLAGVFVLIGALASRVVSTYVSLASTTGPYSAAVLVSFIAATNLTTFLKVPTSTIQVYAFAVLGSAVAVGSRINLVLLAILIIGWVVAPVASHYLSRVIYSVLRESKKLRFVIIGIMAYSATVLGLNDVSNAASSLVGSGVDILLAKVVCGLSMYLGMIMWGPRLARRVGEELIRMDYRKAVSAQLTKSVCISALNYLGLNASMNQTTVSALSALGAKKDVLRGIVKGWIYSPILGFVSAYALSIVLKIGGV